MNVTERIAALGVKLQDAHNRGPDPQLVSILLIVEDLMTVVDDIGVQVADLATTLGTFEAHVATAFTDLNAKIAALELDPTTAAAVEQAISDAKAQLVTADAAAVAEDPGAQGAAPGGGAPAGV